MPQISPKTWLIAGVALLVIAILSLTYCQGKQAGKSGEVVKQQGREIETQQDLGRANSNAAEGRVNDAVKAANERKELDGAIQNSGDPVRQRTLRGCVILRQQGRDTTNIPGCR